MGVYGLTTYLRKNQRVLGETRQFPPPQVSGDTVTTIVVDGLSFIYEVYEQSRIPWVYGGEYNAFARCAVQVVNAWITVGLKVYFVFDGASPELKIPTLVSRLNHTNVQNALLFFRTSPTSRSTPRFLHENRIIPPLIVQSCIETLDIFARVTSKLEVHFADEEGDPYAVELAGRLGAYVVGNDSDFVILNSGRYAGYVPLEGMRWTAPLPVDEYSSTREDQEDGFQTVVSKSKKQSNPVQRQQTSFGLIPPEETPLSDLVLSVTIYTPPTLASHLKLPTTLLPLLASLVGNDFTNNSATQRNVQSLFFDRSFNSSQRITHAANTLSSILNAATQKRKAKDRVESVMDLIDRTVNALLVRSPSSLAAGEIESIVDRIVNAALQYAIDKYEGEEYGPASLWPTPVCALHGGDTCPLLNLFSGALAQRSGASKVNGSSPDESVIMLRSLYLKAFRAGKLLPKLTDILSTGTFWPEIFLDNPDVENVAVSIGRPIRCWIYALLEDGVGILEAREEEALIEDGSPSVSEDGKLEEDPDELIDVVEEGSDEDDDLLAPLRGELRRLRGTEEDDSEAGPASVTSRSRSRPPALPKRVVEYVRRGTRIAPEEVPVPDLAAMMISSGFDETFDPDVWVPVQLRSLEERMALFLHILESNVPAVRNVPPDRLMAVLVLRWIVRTLHQRAMEGGMSKEREKERWTHQEARALLASLGSPRSIHVDNTASHRAVGTDSSPTAPAATLLLPPVDRNVQLMAQVLMAVETIQLLAQVLLLTERVPANMQTLSGQRFHAYLTDASSVLAEDVPPIVWNACTASLEDAFAAEKQKKAKKQKAGQDNKPMSNANNGKRTTTRRGQGLFSLLVDDVA